LDALGKLTVLPDVMIFDGQGIAHPLRLGIASHIGILLDRPAIGCAKSRLCGTHAEPNPERGGHTPLFDGDEAIGAVLRTRTNVKPLFVSPGHRIDISGSIKLVLGCCRKYRLPETTRLAHQLASLSEDAGRG
jgi:deoxyribonuclease V